MKALLLVVLAFSCTNAQSVISNTKINVDELRCLVCRNSLKELATDVKKIDPNKRVDVGGYRLDKDGNIEQKRVSQAKSEVFLSELVEEVCSRMDDYIRAKWKSNGKLTLLKIIVDGGMNPAMSEVDVITDDDLNKSLKYYCEGIMEEHEESIIKHIQQETEDIPSKICAEEAGLCPLGPELGSKTKQEL